MKTRGNVVVEDIKIGDIHYEYGYFKEEIKAQVMSLPVCKEVDGRMQCSWNAQILDCPDKSRIGEIVSYLVTDGFQHYSDPLYTYQAYVKIGNDVIER